MHMKYSKTQLHKIEELLAKMGFKVRYEKGTFNSGYCIVEQNKVIVVNKFFDLDGRVLVLLEILQNLEINEAELDQKSLQLLKVLLKEAL
jgi:hypothetical protein